MVRVKAMTKAGARIMVKRKARISVGDDNGDEALICMEIRASS